jgi:hypothetical protein
MADRYWVGGTSTWDGTAGTKWATTSGGAGGAAVPTAVDDVFLNAASGAVTVTVSGSVPARSLDCNGFTGTLTDVTGATVNIGTSTVPASNIALRLAAGMTLTIVGTFTFIFPGTNTTPQTITTAGKTMPGLTFSGSTGSWQFADNVTATSATITYSSSSTAVLDFNGKTFNFTTFTGTIGTTKTLTLGAAQITMTGSWLFRGTVTANTATITQTGLTLGFDNSGSAGANYGGLSLIQTGSGVYALGAPTNSAGVFVTLANYTRTGTAVKTDGVSIAFNGVTITGTLTLGGNTTQGVNRLLVQGGTLGTQSVITATGAAVVISGDVDFMDIAITGSPSWTNTGSKWVGDALGNGSLITTNRTPPSTRYKIAGGAWGTSSVWSASSGGVTDNRVPLPQDNVVFDSSSGGGTHTIDMPRIGADITCVSGFVGTITRAQSQSQYGSLTLCTGMTFTSISNGTWTFAGRSSNHTITMAGLTFDTRLGNPGTMSFAGPGGKYTLQDALQVTPLGATTGAAPALGVIAGELDTAGFPVTLGSNSTQVAVSNALATLTLGSSTVTIYTTTASATFWNVTAGTVNAASATIVLAGASAGTRTFVGGGKTYGTLRYTVADSPGALAITGANTFGTLEVGPEHRVSLPASTTQVVTTPTLTGRFNGYHRMASGAGSVTLPDSAALSLQGDMDLRALVTLDDWTPAATNTFIGKRTSATATTTSYHFAVLTTGLLQLTIGTGATSASTPSSVAPSFADGSKNWVRVTRRASDSRVQFFTASGSIANPTTSDWTQLGTNQTNTSAGQDTADPVFIGGHGSAASNAPLLPMIGNLYRAQIRNNVLDDGTGIVADVDFTQASIFGQNTFTESSSNAATVTIFDLAQMGDGRVHVISSTGGTPSFISKPYLDAYSNSWRLYATVTTTLSNSDNVRFPSGVGNNFVRTDDSLATSITGDIDIRIRMYADAWATANLPMAGKSASITSDYSWQLSMNATTKQPQFAMSTSGTAQTGSANAGVAVSFADGSGGWIRVTRRQSDGRTQFFTAADSSTMPSSWTQLGTDKTIQSGSAMFDSTAGVTVGVVNPTSSTAATNVYRFQLRNNILDDGTGIVADFNATKTGTVSEDYMRLVDNYAIGSPTAWYAGSHSVDGTGNSGWTFTDPPVAPSNQGNFFTFF